MWKSNYLNEITGDHANENYEVNMWGKYCRIYPEFAHKKWIFKNFFLNIYRSQTDFLYHFICSKGNNSDKEYNKELFIENEYVNRKLLKKEVVITSHERL